MRVHNVTPQFPEGNACRMLVKGGHGSGYGIGYIKSGESGRQEHQGPLVPGPWAYSFLCASVIDNHGGTGAQIEHERKDRRLIEAEFGDLLAMPDGQLFRIDRLRKGETYLDLVLVEVRRAEAFTMGDHEVDDSVDRKRIIDEARSFYDVSERPDMEIQTNAKVMEVEDDDAPEYNGYWVAGWFWVKKEESGEES